LAIRQNLNRKTQVVVDRKWGCKSKLYFSDSIAFQTGLSAIEFLSIPARVFDRPSRIW